MPRPVRLLMVEDSEDDATLILRELRRAGFEPQWERVDQAEAMREALARQGWDIVIADYSLPQFSGPRALATLKDLHIDLPFLIVSGSIGEEEAVTAMKAGAQDYIMKGNLSRLAPAVERELREAAVRRARREAEEKRRQAEDRYRMLVEQIPAVTYIAEIEDDFVPLYVSPQIENLTGYSPAEVSSSHQLWQRQLHPEDRQRVLEERRQTQLAGSPFVCEYRMLTRAGGILWVRDEARLVEESSIGRSFLRGFLVDITERKSAEETIAQMAFHDRVTGLANLIALEERLERVIRECAENQRPAALLQINLNGFTNIKNTLGHHTSDLVLQQVGQRLCEVMPASDLVARVGGDDFAVLLVGADAEEAIQSARRVERALERPILAGALPIEVESTIGAAIYPGDGEEASVLLRAAGVAIETARRACVGYALYKPERDPYKPRSLMLLGALRSAIESGQLRLHYQPTIDLSTGRVLGVEALVRWQHPSLDLVPPDQFIPLAEQGGLIRPLTRWVLNEALRQGHSWHLDGLPLQIAVNLSARNLQDSDLPEHVQELLRIWELPPTCLDLEITESAIMADPPRAMELLERLCSAGVGLAIDDFGTGYSSFAYLRRPPFSQIKVDKSFIMKMATSDDAAAIVRATIDLAHNLGLRVVAEGVESQEIYDCLVALGCDIAQGYHMGRPMPEAELTTWLRESHWAQGLGAALPHDRERVA